MIVVDSHVSYEYSEPSHSVVYSGLTCRIVADFEDYSFLAESVGNMCVIPMPTVAVCGLLRSMEPQTQLVGDRMTISALLENFFQFPLNTFLVTECKEVSR